MKILLISYGIYYRIYEKFIDYFDNILKFDTFSYSQILTEINMFGSRSLDSVKFKSIDFDKYDAIIFYNNKCEYNYDQLIIKKLNCLRKIIFFLKIPVTLSYEQIIDYQNYGSYDEQNNKQNIIYFPIFDESDEKHELIKKATANKIVTFILNKEMDLCMTFLMSCKLCIAKIPRVLQIIILNRITRHYKPRYP